MDGKSISILAKQLCYNFCKLYFDLQSHIYIYIQKITHSQTESNQVLPISEQTGERAVKIATQQHVSVHTNQHVTQQRCSVGNRSMKMTLHTTAPLLLLPSIWRASILIIFSPLTLLEIAL